MGRITSQFGAKSTAAEVGAGHDLRGKRVIITGASAGLGIETACVVASCGAEIVLAVRSPEATTPVVARIEAQGGKAYASALDLADLASIEDFAAREGGAPLHLLINNAGVMACPEMRTAQGFEMQLGVNRVGHFLPTSLLLPALEAVNGARVVVVSSTGHHWSAFDCEDPNFEHTPYEPLIAYGRTKSANALFALELDRRYQAKGVRAFSLMPGAIHTSLGRYMTDEIKAQLGVDGDAAVSIPWKTVQQGSATTVWAALAPELNGQGGLYLEDCAEAEPTGPGTRGGVQPWALDPDAARKLWDWSEAAIASASAGKGAA